MAVQLPSSFAFGAPLPRSVHPLALHIEASLPRALLLSSSLVASVPSSLRNWERQNFAVFLQLFFIDVVDSREASDYVFINRVGEFSSAVRRQHFQEVRRFRCGAVVQ